MPSTPTAEQLADKFSELLRGELGPEKLFGCPTVEKQYAAFQ